MTANQKHGLRRTHAVPEDDTAVTRYTYPNGRGQSEVIFYRIENGGHTLPGPTPLGRLGRWLLGPKNQDFDGPAEIWNFFAGCRQSMMTH